MEAPMQGMSLQGHLVSMWCPWCGVVLCLPTPHPCRNGMFFLTHRIRINGGRRELGMSQPLLHEIERDAGRHCRHAKPMA
jgi:hypothetical protein